MYVVVLWCQLPLLFSQCVLDVAKYIQYQNREVYEQRGIILGDPMDRGLRCVSLQLLLLHCTCIYNIYIYIVSGSSYTVPCYVSSI